MLNLTITSLVRNGSARRNPPLAQLRSNSLGTSSGYPSNVQQPQATLPQSSTQSTQPPKQPSWMTTNEPLIPLRAAPPTTGATSFSTTLPGGSGSSGGDLFDCEWASLQPTSSSQPPAQPPPQQIVNPNNPFLPANAVKKAFEVQM